MRLFKVVSEFNVKTTAIVNLLSSKGFDIENKPNSKVTMEMIEILCDYYDSGINVRHIHYGKKAKHKTIKKGETGVDFEYLFGHYIDDSTKLIDIVDPYIRKPYQIENLMHFLSFVVTQKRDDKKLEINLTTYNKKEYRKYTIKVLEKISANLNSYGIDFSYELDDRDHDRYVRVDDKWKISMGRGLDIYNNPGEWDVSRFDLKFRSCRKFDITYVPKGLFESFDSK